MKTTISELKAYRIMTQREMLCIDESPERIWEKANELILLAEQIKSERAISGMQY